jgi:hypothetical protein
VAVLIAAAMAPNAQAASSTSAATVDGSSARDAVIPAVSASAVDESTAVRIPMTYGHSMVAGSLLALASTVETRPNGYLRLTVSSVPVSSSAINPRTGESTLLWGG